MNTISAVGASFSRTVKTFEISHNPKAEKPTADLLETIRHVDINIREAKRLRHVKKDLLNGQERKWIDGVINDTEEAFRGATQLVEPIRAEKTSIYDLDNRKAKWVFRGSTKIIDKHVRLSACHQSLTAAIMCMFSKDIVDARPAQKEKENEVPPPYDAQLEQLLTWRNRRKRGRSSMSSKGDVALGPDHTETNAPSPTTRFTSRRDISGGTVPSIGSDDATPRPVDERPVAKSDTQYAIERPISATGSTCDYFNCLSRPNDPSQGSDQRPKSATSNTPFCLPFISRPRANSLPAGQAGGEAQRSSLPYPMSPSDYLRGSPLRPASKACKSPLSNTYTSSDDSLSHFDGRIEECDTEFSGSRNRISKPGMINNYNLGLNLLKTHEPKGSHIEPASRSFEGADGLHLVEDAQPVYLPYRIPQLSFSTTSLCPSLTSPPENSYNAHQTPNHDLPRLPLGFHHNQDHSAVELGTASPSSESPGLGYESIRMRLPTQGSRLALEPGKPSRVGQGGARRGRRDWLMFHANRRELGFWGG